MVPLRSGSRRSETHIALCQRPELAGRCQVDLAETRAAPLNLGGDVRRVCQVTVGSCHRAAQHSPMCSVTSTGAQDQRAEPLASKPDGSKGRRDAFSQITFKAATVGAQAPEAEVHTPVRSGFG